MTRPGHGRGKGLRHASYRYRTHSLTKAAIREPLPVMFALYDTLWAQAREEAPTVGGSVGHSTGGDISGRLGWWSGDDAYVVFTKVGAVQATR